MTFILYTILSFVVLSLIEFFYIQYKWKMGESEENGTETTTFTINLYKNKYINMIVVTLIKIFTYPIKFFSTSIIGIILVNVILSMMIGGVLF